MDAPRHASPLMSSFSPNLNGTVQIPGDKSISHRAVMLATSAIGRTVISGLLQSDDVLATVHAMAALGARIERIQDGSWHIHGVGIGGYRQSGEPIDFGNSGTGVRLALGLTATTAMAVRFTGDASLRSRPMNRIISPLRSMGARFDANGDDRLPITMHGARDPIPITYRLPVASAQVKSAVLLAGLNTPGHTTVIEPVPVRDHTERMLAAFGAKITVDTDSSGARVSTVEGHHELTPTDIAVPGDPSSAAFAVVAALITPESCVTVKNVMLNPARTGLFETLREMGADLEISNETETGGERTGDITARSSPLKGMDVPDERAPSMIDEYPALAVAAAYASGITRTGGLSELRVKESDRLSAIAAGLAANGVNCEIGEDWLKIEGGGQPSGGGVVRTNLDHRIAMAFLVLGLGAKSAVTVDDGSTIATSFPGFADHLTGLGARIGAP